MHALMPELSCFQNHRGCHATSREVEREHRPYQSRIVRDKVDEWDQFIRGVYAIKAWIVLQAINASNRGLELERMHRNKCAFHAFDSTQLTFTISRSQLGSWLTDWDAEDKLPCTAKTTRIKKTGYIGSLRLMCACKDGRLPRKSSLSPANSRCSKYELVSPLCHPLTLPAVLCGSGKVHMTKGGR